MIYISEFLEELLFITSEMASYLLLGFLFAGILHVFVKKEMIGKLVGKNNLKSVLYAALVGVPLPLCSCGVIPTGISFYRDGASKGATISFLISTPQTGIDSIMATYSLLGLPFAIIRPVAALFSGIIGGSVENYLINSNKDTESNWEGSKEDTEIKSNKFISMLNYAFVEFLQDIAKWLIIGLLIAALMAVVIPDDFFSKFIGNDLLSMLMVLVASIPLYVCATGSVPIAAVLLMKGLSPGAALVFLMAGPATNAATITVIGKSMGKKTFLTYLISIIISSILFGLLIDNSFLRELIMNPLDLENMNHSHLIPEWLKYASSIILILLTLNSLFVRYKNRFIKPSSNNSMIMDQKIFYVNGMTCNHCKANVENGISELKGVKSASVDLSDSTLKVDGTIDIKELKNEIEKLGYTIIGEKK